MMTFLELCVFVFLTLKFHFISIRVVVCLFSVSSIYDWVCTALRAFLMYTIEGLSRSGVRSGYFFIVNYNELL